MAVGQLFRGSASVYARSLARPRLFDANALADPRMFAGCCERVAVTFITIRFGPCVSARTCERAGSACFGNRLEDEMENWLAREFAARFRHSFT